MKVLVGGLITQVKERAHTSLKFVGRVAAIKIRQNQTQV